MLRDGDPWADFANDFRGGINSILGNLTGTPQINIDTIADVESLGLPDFQSAEDVDAFMRQYEGSLGLGSNFNGTELRRLGTNAIDAYINFHNDPSDENRIILARQLQAHRQGASAIHQQLQGQGVFNDYINRMRSLLGPGSQFDTAYNAAAADVNTPVFSEEDILRMINSSQTAEHLSSGQLERNILQSGASRGTARGGHTSDMISNARINLSRDLGLIANNVRTEAQTINAKRRSEAQGIVGGLTDILTRFISPIESAYSNFQANNTPGVGIIDGTALNQLGADLANLNFTNEQLAHGGFQSTVDTVKNDLLALTTLFGNDEPSSSGSSGGFNLGGSVGIPGFGSINAGGNF